MVVFDGGFLCGGFNRIYRGAFEGAMNELHANNIRKFARVHAGRLPMGMWVGTGKFYCPHRKCICDHGESSVCEQSVEIVEPTEIGKSIMDGLGYSGIN
jgi:hypothetical protein